MNVLPLFRKYAIIIKQKDWKTRGDSMDNHTQEQRHYNMSRIRSKNTSVEERVRKYLFSEGFRYRKNDKRYPGHPDIVLPRYKTVVFINGCFWHMHDCAEFVLPKSNLEYWLPKLERNKTRDNANTEKLEALGWNVIVFWECELKKDGWQESLKQRILDGFKN